MYEIAPMREPAPMLVSATVADAPWMRCFTSRPSAHAPVEEEAPTSVYAQKMDPSLRPALQLRQEVDAEQDSVSVIEYTEAEMSEISCLGSHEDRSTMDHQNASCNNSGEIL
jgi:hypothetical protein